MHVGFVYASIISPWIWGCWAGEGRKKKRSWVFQATPFDLQSKYSTAVCRDTSVQGLYTAVMEPGHRTRAAPLQRQHKGHFCLFHRYHPQPTTSGLSASWQGTELGRGDQRITGSAFSCHSSQAKLRDTNTCLPTHCAVILLRACRTITPIPSKSHSDSQQHWLHTLQASKPAAGYSGEQHAPKSPELCETATPVLCYKDPGKHCGSGICTHCSNRSQSHAGKTPRSMPSLWLLQLVLHKMNFEMAVTHLGPTLARTAKHMVNCFSPWSFGIACVTVLSIWDTCKIKSQQAAIRKASNTSTALANT